MKNIVSALLSLERMLTRFNMVVAAVCGVVLFLFMFMEVGDVTGRYVFLSPITGTREVGENVLAFAAFMSWAAVLANNQHIRVLVVLDRMSPRWRVWLELLVCMVGFLLMLPIAWYGLGFAATSFKTQETGLSTFIVLYPGKMALFVGCSLFTIQFFVQFISRLFTWLAGQTYITKEQSLS
jgi:TRAP-type C4-dicarboxylate transport system permease small subunit